jgi:hypothetical protein
MSSSGRGGSIPEQNAAQPPSSCATILAQEQLLFVSFTQRRTRAFCHPTRRRKNKQTKKRIHVSPHHNSHQPFPTFVRMFQIAFCKNLKKYLRVNHKLKILTEKSTWWLFIFTQVKNPDFNRKTTMN